jgi:hypothetical protein
LDFDKDLYTFIASMQALVPPKVKQNDAKMFEFFAVNSIIRKWEAVVKKKQQKIAVFRHFLLRGALCGP